MDLKPGQRVGIGDIVGVVDRVDDGIAWIKLPQNAPGSLFGFCFADDVPEMEVVE